MRAPVAPVGFLLFCCVVLICTLLGGFLGKKSFRSRWERKDTLTLCLLRSLLGLPFCGMGVDVDVDVDGDVDVDVDMLGDGEESK